MYLGRIWFTAISLLLVSCTGYKADDLTQILNAGKEARLETSATRVVGWLDGVFPSGGENYATGWACGVGSSNPIAFHVYVGGPSGGGGTLVYGGWTDQPSEPGVAAACSSNGTRHRFRIPLNQFRDEFAGQPIYIYGIDGAVGLLNGSGQHTIPKINVSVPAFQTKFGIFYVLWHCPFAEGNPFGNGLYDISRFLAGQGSLGPVGSWHWWSRPAAGYYCLTRDRQILRNHAILLRDAGIDFVYVDATNHPDTVQADRPREMITEPFNALLQEWSQIPGAPKVVPWAPVGDTGNMMEWMTSRLSAYPNLYFNYLGKPLIMIPDNRDNPWVRPNRARVNAYRSRYTVRKSWVYGYGERSNWSFFAECANNYQFKQSQATLPCKQTTALFSGQQEQVSISTAYQKYLMSEAHGESIPKFGGRTFVKQFETLYDNPTIPLATITGWNEWIAIRFCFDSAGGVGVSNCVPGRDRVFVDQYDQNYNRDIEPQSGGDGDFYYRLMKGCIAAYKRGQRCDVNSATPPVGGQPAPAPPPPPPPPPPRVNYCTGTPVPVPGNTGPGVIYGNIDEVVLEGGRYFLTGWACRTTVNAQIPIHVYLRGPAGAGQLALGDWANKPSEPGVAAACGIVGSAYRFKTDITSLVGAYSGQSLYVHGLDISGSVPNHLILNSGKCRVP